MLKPFKTKGYILLEFSAAILIIATLITIGTNTEAYNNIELNLAASNLLSNIENARLKAISENTTITICPSTDYHSCSYKWQNSKQILFQKNDIVYKYIELNKISSRWDASLNNTPKIIFMPNGNTSGEQGSISLDKGPTSYKITLNRSGNAKLSFRRH